MPNRLKALLLLLPILISGCQGIFGNAEPYSNRNDPYGKPNTPVSPMKPQKTYVWVDLDYTCIKPDGTRIASHRNILSPDSISPRLLGDACGNGKRDLRPEEVQSYAIDDNKGVDEGIYGSYTEFPNSQARYYEVICTLKAKKIEIAISTNANKDRYGKMLTEAQSSEGGVQMNGARTYVGTGFELTLAATPIPGKPFFFEGKLKNEATPLECRANLR